MNFFEIIFNVVCPLDRVLTYKNLIYLNLQF